MKYGARKLAKDFEFFTNKVTFIPKREIVAYDYIAESKDLPYERIESLNKLEQDKIEVVITTIEALIQRMVPKDILYKHTLHFEVGKSYSLEQIKQDLLHLGYTRCDLIEGRGQFSLRGGILDIALNEKREPELNFGVMK